MLFGWVGVCLVLVALASILRGRDRRVPSRLGLLSRAVLHLLLSLSVCFDGVKTAFLLVTNRLAGGNQFLRLSHFVVSLIGGIV